VASGRIADGGLATGIFKMMDNRNVLHERVDGLQTWQSAETEKREEGRRPYITKSLDEIDEAASGMGNSD